MQAGSGRHRRPCLAQNGRPRSSGGMSFMIADSVRYMSVHSRKQRDSAGPSGTRRHRSRRPERSQNPQAMARFRWWWQVQDSNLGRRSRRFYRPLPLAARATCLAPPHGTGTVKDSGHGGRLWRAAARSWLMRCRQVRGAGRRGPSRHTLHGIARPPRPAASVGMRDGAASWVLEITATGRRLREGGDARPGLISARHRASHVRPP